MYLFFSFWKKVDKKGSIAHIIDLTILTRSDKRRDRVEISPEQLSAASLEAEKISKQLNQTVRVVSSLFRSNLSIIKFDF